MLLEGSFGYMPLSSASIHKLFAQLRFLIAVRSDLEGSVHLLIFCTHLFSAFEPVIQHCGPSWVGFRNNY